ncbi:MAG: carbohydrate ABC transporter permease [Lachnospiraceae bacterium]|nr:carbohydrate ABC transporter permease [Lachnospiraceae bacterium]
MSGKKVGSTKSKILYIILYTFLILMALLYLLPLVWIALTSLKDDKTLFISPFAMPEKLMFENYTFAWTAGYLGKATLNSVFVCVITLLLSMIVGSMAAFAIGRMRWKFSGLAMTYFLTGMMIPVHCVLIPLFTKFAKVGLSNNLWGLILPYLTFSLPVTIFIMTGFFQGLPNELFESACIDGCSIYKSFTHIALPLSRTGLFVTGLMTFVANWNELLLAMVFISDDTKKTLPVSLSKFVGPYNTNYSQMFAAIVIAIVPTIIVYCVFSNQIVDGLTAGAVKG